MAFVILDGKVIASDRCREKTTSVKGETVDLWYPGKAHFQTWLACTNGAGPFSLNPDGTTIMTSPDGARVCDSRSPPALTAA